MDCSPPGSSVNDIIQERIPEWIAIYWVSLIAQLVKNQPAMQEILVQFLGLEDFLEMGIATHSSILA